MKGQFNNLGVEFLRVYNKTLCARRKNLQLRYEEECEWHTKDELGGMLFELNCMINANGREILRLRGNKWSF